MIAAGRRYAGRTGGSPGRGRDAVGRGIEAGHFELHIFVEGEIDRLWIVRLVTGFSLQTIRALRGVQP